MIKSLLCRVEEVQPAAVQSHGQPRDLVVDLEVDRLVRLHPDDKLVGRLVQIGPEAPLVEVPRHVPELDPDLCSGTGSPSAGEQSKEAGGGGASLPSAMEGLAGLHQEGDAVPPGIVDEEGGGGERRREAVLRHRRVVGVGRISSTALRVALVLAHHHIVKLQVLHRPKNLHLIMATLWIIIPKQHGWWHQKRK